MDIQNANKKLSQTYYDELRVFKHDFANMISVIRGYINNNDMEGLKKYFSTFEEDYENIQIIESLNSNNINDAGIYNLLVSKYQKATYLGITMKFDIFFNFKNLNISVYHISKILGILLDNAIEASKDCTSKEIKVSFRELPKQKVQLITIENTYLQKDLDMSKIFNKGYSGKKNHTGIGLWEVSEILKEYDNVYLKTSSNKEIFKQELHLYY